MFVDTIYKGFIIGILVSAPMGPIGLLCIQRTINKGRWHGFLSGVGAAFSDLSYAVITCMGMGIVISFVENNQRVLQILGSILLMAYGIYTFFSNPSKNLKKTTEGIKTYSLPQDAITAFLLTFSNPLIILIYIALFARFNFISPDQFISPKAYIYSMLAGLFCIFLGALAWWYAISFFVAKLRKIFNVRGMWIMNRIIGCIIFVLSLMGIFFSFK
ncbi:MAG: LysE family transporter [Candidatus Azobacteroides sp.]|nr:LysE family transporter [Candidatus Azobacteroides sp.]